MKKSSSKTRMKTKIVPKRRTMLERVEDIFNFIENQYEVFPKSRLKEIGINPSSAVNWLKMIEYIQNQPRIRLISSEKSLLVEKVEGKYQAMIRKTITDESIPFEQRMLLVNNYLPSLYIREKLELGRVRNYLNPKEVYKLSKQELVQFAKDYNIDIFDLTNLKELQEGVKIWLEKKTESF